MAPYPNKKVNVKLGTTSMRILFLALLTSCTSSVATVVWPEDGPPLNDYFSMEVHVEDKSVTGLAVNADMPSHGHGMITRPVVEQIRPGVWRVDGMMFHMPGFWELYLDLERGKEVTQEIHEVTLEHRS